MKTIHIVLLFCIAALIFLSWKNEEYFFSGEKKKIVSIGIGKITVPSDWKSEMVTPVDTFSRYGISQYLIGGKDTLKFGWFPMEADYDTMMSYTVNDHFIRTSDGGNYYHIDSINRVKNKKVRFYNDSLIKMNPEIATHCKDRFDASNSDFSISYKIPCKSTAGKIHANIYVEKKYPVIGILGMQSSSVSPERALEIIEILKTLKPAK